MRNMLNYYIKRSGQRLAACVVGLTALLFPLSAVAQTVTWDVGTLPANGTATLTITVNVDEGAIVDNDLDPDTDPTDGAETTNTATITAVDQSDTDDTNDSDTAEVAINTDITFAITKTSDAGADTDALGEAMGVSVNEGDVVNYTITITHPGSGAPQVDTLTLLDTVAGVALASAPAGLNVAFTDNNTGGDSLNTSATQTGDLFSGGLIIGDAAQPLNFDDGDVITITYAQTIAMGIAGSQVDNTIASTGADTELDFTASSYVYDLIVSGDVDLVLNKEATGLTDHDPFMPVQVGDSNDVAEGQNVEYVISVTHNGDGSGGIGAQVDDFSITDAIDISTLDASSIAITAVTLNGTGLTAGSDYVDNSALATGSLDLQFNGITIDQNDVVAVTYNADVQTGLAGPLPLGFTNSATATLNNTNLTDVDGSNNTDVIQLDVIGLDLQVVKTSNIASTATVNEDGTVTYTITITNNSSLPATGIELEDLLPAGLTVENVGDCTGSQGTASGTGSANNCSF